MHWTLKLGEATAGVWKNPLVTTGARVHWFGSSLLLHSLDEIWTFYTLWTKVGTSKALLSFFKKS